MTNLMMKGYDQSSIFFFGLTNHWSTPNKELQGKEKFTRQILFSVLTLSKFSSDCRKFN